MSYHLSSLHSIRVAIRAAFENARYITGALAVAATFSVPSLAMADDNGIVTVPSAHSAESTVARLQATIDKIGFKNFGTLDHAQGATEYKLEMPFSTVVVFGNPKLGTPSFIQTPELAIDLPLKALVWEDQNGDVFLSYNSSEYLYETIYERHGQPYSEEQVTRFAEGIANIMNGVAGE